MTVEKSQIKFAKSEQTGEMIGFVSRHSKTRQLKGVRENSTFGKKICVLSQDLKGTIRPNVLYGVELKSMHSGNGYVVVSAEPLQFKVRIETLVIPHKTYQVQITFGNKTVYFDPKNGKSPSSNTVEGVAALLSSRTDIEDKEQAIENFRQEAEFIVRQMKKDGYGYQEIG